MKHLIAWDSGQGMGHWKTAEHTLNYISNKWPDIEHSATICKPVGHTIPPLEIPPNVSIDIIDNDFDEPHVPNPRVTHSFFDYISVHFLADEDNHNARKEWWSDLIMEHGFRNIWCEYSYSLADYLSLIDLDRNNDFNVTLVGTPYILPSVNDCEPSLDVQWLKEDMYGDFKRIVFCHPDLTIYDYSDDEECELVFVEQGIPDLYDPKVAYHYYHTLPFDFKIDPCIENIIYNRSSKYETRWLYHGVLDDEPTDLETIRQSQGSLTHHGGYYTTIECLARGIPQELKPLHFEHRLNKEALGKIYDKFSY